MFQDSFFTGNLNMDGGTLALAGGAGTSVQMNGNFSLSAEGELKLDLSEFGVLTNGMTVLSTTGLSNITSIQASFADGVGGTISLSQNGRELIYTEIPMLLWAGGAQRSLGCGEYLDGWGNSRHLYGGTCRILHGPGGGARLQRAAGF